MKKYLVPALIFGFSSLVYFAVATDFTFRPKWALDYFNPLAQSLLHGRLDLVNPPETYDLSYFKSKWYLPWGVLPSILLIVPQLILGHFMPAIYLTVLFAGLDILFMYLLLRRMANEFFQNFTFRSQMVVLALFAFGTVHFYVGTLGSVWHVDQMVTNFFGTLGIFLIFKKNRQIKDYILSAWTISLALLGRGTIVLLILLPAILYVWQYKIWLKDDRLNKIVKGVFIFILPLALFSCGFFVFNFLRFQNPFEFGYSYIKEAPSLEYLRQSSGTMSVSHIPRNLWYMLFEIPSLVFNGNLKLNINLNGNSIFFLTPPFLYAFLATPLVKKGKKIIVDLYVFALWSTAIITIIPSILIYSTGWMQFSYRYSLDITVILVLLSVFGTRGKLGILSVSGIVFSIMMYILGIKALM